MSLIQKIFFHTFWKSKFFQSFHSKMYYWSLYSMNYGGGGDLRTSGEKWLLQNILPRHIEEKMVQPIIFDVGANIGGYSQLVNEILPQSQIYAFEPCSETFIQLENNLKNILSVKTFNLGLSNKSRSETIYNYSFEGESASVLASLEKRLPTQHGKIEVTNTENITLTTIDEFCSDHDIKHIALLKLDIEGHELNALKGAKEMIDQSRIELIQFEFGPPNLYSRTSFFDFWEMLSPKYEIFRLLPNEMELISYYEEQREVYLVTNFLAKKKY